MHPIYNYIKQSLAPIYPDEETSAMAKWILTDVFGLSTIDLYTGKDNDFSVENRSRVEDIVSRLLQHEPLQYILGSTIFCGLTFKVNDSVLIPRPETEELVEWVRTDWMTKGRLTVLDIGTGSGCIAVSIGKLLPDTEVWAWDISEKALRVAEENAEQNKVGVHFVPVDVLQVDTLHKEYDVIVSNPPYITISEKKEMDDNVTEWEPHTALFVPDNDPLLFYRRIAELSMKGLKSGGALYFEINREFGEEMVRMMVDLGYSNVTLRKDISGNDRMVKGIWNRKI